MPVLDPERVTTRSALRYRPIAMTDQARPDPRVARQRRTRADSSACAMQAIPADLDREKGASPPVRPRVVSSGMRRKAMPAPPARGERHLHPLFFVGTGLLLFVLLWVGVSQALLWGNNVLNGWRYGFPRTFQMDSVVGHHDSAGRPSHFLAINLHGLIEVIEWPGGDASRARIYLGPQLLGSGSDLEPVTLRFIDLTSSHLPDMVIEVQGSQIVLINDQGSFRSIRPDEQGPIMQRLRQLGQ